MSEHGLKEPPLGLDVFAAAAQRGEQPLSVVSFIGHHLHSDSACEREAAAQNVHLSGDGDAGAGNGRSQVAKSPLEKGSLGPVQMERVGLWGSPPHRRRDAELPHTSLAGTVTGD